MTMQDALRRKAGIVLARMQRGFEPRAIMLEALNEGGSPGPLKVAAPKPRAPAGDSWARAGALGQP